MHAKSIAAAGVIAAALFASPADAQPAGDVGADLGTGWNILQIPAAAFMPEDSTMTYETDGKGYVYTQAAGLGYAFVAPVTLPSGAGIGFLGLYAYDSSSSSDVLARLILLKGWGCTFMFGLCQLPVPPSSSSLVFVATSGAPGDQYASSDEINPLHTVNNNVLQNGAQYVVRVYATTTGARFVFRGVDIWWKRQISPAPSAARFTDVPMNAQFFAEVEALAESGITLGCTATTFCPDAPLTRRQMAAFLARALGLYWQY